MIKKTIVTGEMQENCYLLLNEETKKGVIVDPGDDAEKIMKVISGNGMIPEAILITHGHFDHIMAADELRERYDIPVIISETDAAMIGDAEKNLGRGFLKRSVTLTADRTVKDGEELELCYRIRVIATPGHTPGGVCFYVPEGGLLFSGDTLFRESIGRTDMGGSMTDLLTAVREKLFVLPVDTVVLPGHGFPSSIGHEKEANPFF